jgi:hypothetical protein
MLWIFRYCFYLNVSNHFFHLKTYNFMASNQETGHAVNNSNFKLMIDKCASYGKPYNPSNADITLAAMTAKWIESDTIHGDLTKAVMNSKNPINERELLFEPVNKTVTKSINYLKSTKASKLLKDDAKGLGNRMRGFGVKVTKLPDGTPDPKGVSTSHQGYVQRADAFKQLVDLYASETNYAPNEVELQVVTLQNLYLEMKKMNDNIGNIIGPVEKLRADRNTTLYAKETGIVDISLACKAYVTGLFGARSAESKMVSGLKFTRPKN